MGGCRPFFVNFDGLVEGTFGGEVKNTQKNKEK